TISGVSGDGKTLKSRLNARPDKIQSDRLFRILNDMVEDKLGGRNAGSHQFDCAEPHAVANMSDFDVPLEDIRVTSIKVYQRDGNGEARPPCANCKQWLEWDAVQNGYKIKKALLDRSWRETYRIGNGRVSGANLKKQLGL